MSENFEKYRYLIDAAKEVAEKAYAPYSISVGSAVLTTDGKVFRGCNVENSAYGACLCAERTAVSKAVSEGYRSFQAVATICKTAYDIWPCGICRQFISEFGIEVDIISEGKDGKLQCLKLRDLLPRHFGPDSLDKVKST